MTTPHPHIQVTRLSRMGRRRSQSVTLPNANVRGQSMRRKDFLAQLKKERLKQQNKYNEEDEHEGNQQKHSEEQNHQPSVSQLAKSAMTMSMKRYPPPSAVTVTKVKRGISPGTLNFMYLQDDEQNQGQHGQTNRMQHFESTTSFEKHNLTTLTRNHSNLGSLETSMNPSTTSSTHLMAKSEIFDEKSFVTDNKDQARRNGVKDDPHKNVLKNDAIVNLNEREKNQNVQRNKFYKSSSASFMTAIIAIVIGVVAFAFGLSALIVALLVRATVESKLASNSTSSSSSESNGILPNACSAYTTIDDPTRSISAPGYALGCDNTAPFSNQSIGVWIRFIGTGGSTLPLSSPGMNLCGSTGTGWYAGSMPSSTGQITNGTACFTWYTTSSDPALDQHREAANVVSDTSIVNINQNVINDKHIDTNSQTSSFRHAPVPVPTGFTTSLNISYYKYQVNLSDHEYHCPESQKCDSEFKCQNFDFFQISVGRYKN
ncbi:unnamed protein product [Rotaria socialis]|uniref:Uncharacterized protein n=3 Tax=Rotaria socialis TaxID=392032 RepID=A0A820TZZ0_9BILA|nr:unnamed protein product [Rotaria socialis]